MDKVKCHGLGCLESLQRTGALRPQLVVMAVPLESLNSWQDRCVSTGERGALSPARFLHMHPPLNRGLEPALH